MKAGCLRVLPREKIQHQKAIRTLLEGLFLCVTLLVLCVCVLRSECEICELCYANNLGHP